jgi:hypothetical protein
MKTNSFLFIVFALTSVFADTIYLRNGQEVKGAVVTEVSDSGVKYKIGQRETVYIVKKSDIALILYDDGTKDMFEPKLNEKPIADHEKAEEPYLPKNDTAKKQIEVNPKESAAEMARKKTACQADDKVWENNECRKKTQEEINAEGTEALINAGVDILKRIRKK